MFAADDSLQVAVLPVEVTCLHRPGEHRPPWPGQRIYGRTTTQSVSQSPVLTLQVESTVECVLVLTLGQVALWQSVCDVWKL